MGDYLICWTDSALCTWLHSLRLLSVKSCWMSALIMLMSSVDWWWFRAVCSVTVLEPKLLPILNVSPLSRVFMWPGMANCGCLPLSIVSVQPVTLYSRQREWWFTVLAAWNVVQCMWVLGSYKGHIKIGQSSVPVDDHHCHKNDTASSNMMLDFPFVTSLSIYLSLKTPTS